jgi:hypothetical protein
VNYKEHSVSGLGFFGISIVVNSHFEYSQEFSIIEFLFFMLLSLVGSNFPDFDHPNAHFSKSVPKSLFLIGIVGLLIYYGFERVMGFSFSDENIFLIFMWSSVVSGILVFLFTVVVYRFSGHRGVLHAPFLYVFLLIFLSFLFYFLELDFFLLYFAFGGVFFGHLIPDLMTHGGLRVLYPFSKRFYRIIPSFLYPYIRFIVLFGSIAIFIYSVLSFFMSKF